jgi:hypothetical protein
VAHEGVAIEVLADGHGGGDVEEGDEDAAEGFEGCPGVDRGVLVDEFLDLDEIGGMEYLGFKEVLGMLDCLLEWVAVSGQSRGRIF